MILDTKILLKPLNFSKFYSEKGYDFKSSKDIIEVNIEDLMYNSSVLLNIKCDFCDSVKILSYSKYNKNTNNQTRKYSCSAKCSITKKIETNLEKYGVEYPTQSNDIITKRNENNLIKYGVENPIVLKEIQEKVKQTNLEKYGVTNAFQSEEIKKKIKQTNLEKYGVEIPTQSEKIYDKIKQTNLEKYGVEYPTQSEKIYDKIKKTNIVKYGVTNVLNYNIVKNKEVSKITKKNKAINKYKKLLNIDYSIINFTNPLFEILHKKCDKKFIISRKNLYDRLKDNTCLCTICFPISEQTSIKEKEIVNWLKELNICSTEHNIDFIEGDRTILEGRELDIYIPSKNIAIEFNGLYWHSELYKDKNYHLEKSLKCQEKGVQLLHIWEDEWVYKQEIVKSIILNCLGLISEKIYARQTEVRVIEDSKLVRQFLDTNHIQGYSQSSIKLGLYYQNELVSLMTFGYRHTNAKKEFELIRFCNKINSNVIGAASKLFNYFKQNYHFTELISYSDFRLFDGQMYQTLGFTKQHLSKPDYFWCKNLERKHRFNFNKQKLIKEGFDGSKTEVEIMHERGYYRIFGCGQYRWIYKKREV